MMKLSELSFQNFLLYSEQKSISINKDILRIVFDFCCKKNLRVYDRTCRIYWDCDTGCISQYLEKDDKTDIIELHTEELFREVWCRAEWVVRCLTKHAGYESYVRNLFGKALCDQMKHVLTN